MKIFLSYLIIVFASINQLFLDMELQEGTYWNLYIES